MASLRERRHEALTELLKGDHSFEEIEKIVGWIDKGVAEAEVAKEKGNNQKIKAVAVVGSVISIVAGGVIAAKVDKKAGVAMIAAGSLVLAGAAGGESKLVKKLLASLAELQGESDLNGEVVEV